MTVLMLMRGAGHQLESCTTRRLEYGMLQNRKLADIYACYFKTPGWIVNFRISTHTTSESGIFVKKPWDLESRTEI